MKDEKFLCLARGRLTIITYFCHLAGGVVDL